MREAAGIAFIAVGLIIASTLALRGVEVAIGAVLGLLAAGVGYLYRGKVE